MTKIRVVYANELPPCDTCGEPWGEEHGLHYADGECLGPAQAADREYDITLARDGTVWAEVPDPVSG